MLSTAPYKGVRDFFPDDLKIRNYIFATWRKVCASFGFEEYDGPFLEPLELFASKSGEELVNEQLYSFTDRGDRKVAIRPEMTPTVSRMAAEKISQNAPIPLKWFSIANFYRYEKPQKGRGREFFQLNVDIFGEESVYADLEILLLNDAIMTAFGAKPNMYQIKVNNRYLVDFLFENIVQVTGETKKKLSRYIDKKSKMTNEEFKKMLLSLGLSEDQITKVYTVLDYKLEDLEKITYLPEKAKMLPQLLRLAQNSNVKGVVYDPTIIRGLDYYDGNVFEQFDLTQGNTRSMFGGGRYDGLISLFMDKKVPAVGFAPGDITFTDFLKAWNLLPDLTSETTTLITMFPGNEACIKASYNIAAKLRKVCPVETYLNTETELTKQIKYADRKGYAFVVIIGPDEMQSNSMTLKDLKNRTQQKVDKVTELAALITHAK